MTACRVIGTDHPLLAELRAEPYLDSNIEAVIITDVDLIIHRYAEDPRRRRSRNVRDIVNVEVKLLRSEPIQLRAEKDPRLAAQLETYRLMNAVWAKLRGRHYRLNTGKDGDVPGGYVPGISVRIASAYKAGEFTECEVRFHGYHLLEMSGMTLADSESIWWDGTQIDSIQVIDVLAFRRNPHNLKPSASIRPHKRTQPPPLLKAVR